MGGATKIMPIFSFCHKCQIDLGTTHLWSNAYLYGLNYHRLLFLLRLPTYSNCFNLLRHSSSWPSDWESNLHPRQNYKLSSLIFRTKQLCILLEGWYTEKIILLFNQYHRKYTFLGSGVIFTSNCLPHSSCQRWAETITILQGLPVKSSPLDS